MQINFVSVPSSGIAIFRTSLAKLWMSARGGKARPRGYKRRPKLTFESLRLDARCQNSFCPFLAVGFDPFCSLFRRVGEWLEAKRDQAFCHVR
jgi:hypothetical protein